MDDSDADSVGVGVVAEREPCHTCAAELSLIQRLGLRFGEQEVLNRDFPQKTRHHLIRIHDLAR
jgi:hypothetical protein